MESRIAAKRLTASDLTFFAWHYRNRNAGNQKAINLNADVFVSVLYPSLSEAVHDLDGRVPLDLSIYGPGRAGLHNVQRKIVKHDSYKNWRLNGEFINGPDDAPDRYNLLQPGDAALFEFTGRIYPTAAKLVLVSQALPDDRAIYERITQYLGNRGMAALSLKDLRLLTAGLERDDHPFFELTLDDEFEDAALGGTRGRTVLWRRTQSRVLGRAELERARERAEEVGRVGEELVNAYLRKLKATGAIADYVWVSSQNAVAPYDFTVMLTTGIHVAIDVKATNGSFERPIHVSFAELAEMARVARYDLYRVFYASEAGGMLRVLENSGEFARIVLKQLSGLAEGVSVDSVSLLPSSLAFGAPAAIGPAVETEGVDS